jgi:hypothetical protein
VLGAIVGGRAGGAIAQASQFGVGAAYLRFPREYERQADIEGAHLMARAGYDPREMANIFKTIEQTSGPGGPQWLSDHPNPGNRYEYINQEAALLTVENPVRETRAFDQVKTHLKRLPPAPTTEQATRNASNRAPGGAAPGPPAGVPPSGHVEPPAARYTSYAAGSQFRVSVPANWRELQSQSSVTFAPEGAYGQYNGANIFTHGVEIGIARNETHDLLTATDELIQSLKQGNPRMHQPSNYRSISIGDRQGLTTRLSNVSEATGAPETIEVFTAVMRNGNLLYVLAVAPADAFDDYQPAFGRVVQSIQLMDASR